MSIRKLAVTAQLSPNNKGIYVSVCPTKETISKLRYLHEALLSKKLSGVSPIGDWHVTVCYSKVPSNNVYELYDKFNLDSKRIYRAMPNKLEYWTGHKNHGVIVLTFVSPELAIQNGIIQSAGYKATFPDYTPHLTLASYIHPSIDMQQAEALVADMNSKLINTGYLEFTGIRIEDVS